MPRTDIGRLQPPVCCVNNTRPKVQSPAVAKRGKQKKMNERHIHVEGFDRRDCEGFYPRFIEIQSQIRVVLNWIKKAVGLAFRIACFAPLSTS